MSKRSEKPECRYEHHDCFALTIVDHKCNCLEDTDFKGRDCPFYKPESEVSPDIIAKKYLED